VQQKVQNNHCSIEYSFPEAQILSCLSDVLCGCWQLDDMTAGKFTSHHELRTALDLLWCKLAPSVASYACRIPPASSAALERQHLVGAGGLLTVFSGIAKTENI